MARELVDLIAARNAEGRETRLILPCGPMGWYGPWTAAVNARRVSLARVSVFHMDECLDWQGRPLPANHPYNFRTFMQRHFYGGIEPELAVPEAQRHWLLPATVERMRDALAEAPVDLTLGGWGQDGHVAYNQARRHPYLAPTLEELRGLHDPHPGEQRRHDPGPGPTDLRVGVPVGAPHVDHARDARVPVRAPGARLQRHRSLEADRAARRALLGADAGLSDDAACSAIRTRWSRRPWRPRATPSPRTRTGSSFDRRTDPAGAARTRPIRCWSAWAGSERAIVFALDGSHELGRNESRPGRLLRRAGLLQAAHHRAVPGGAAGGAAGERGPRLPRRCRRAAWARTRSAAAAPRDGGGGNGHALRAGRPRPSDSLQRLLPVRRRQRGQRDHQRVRGGRHSPCPTSRRRGSLVGPETIALAAPEAPMGRASPLLTLAGARGACGWPPSPRRRWRRCGPPAPCGRWISSP